MLDRGEAGTSHADAADALAVDPLTVSLRAVEPGDERFIADVYASTRASEMALVPWTEEQKAQFVAMQFAAQQREYQMHYPQAAHDVILVGGRPAGRLYVDRREAEIHIIDIAILPEFRNRGVGTSLLGDLLREGFQAGRPVRIYVEINNPAQRLYLRLGFVPVEQHGLYLLMERTPDRGGAD